MFNVTASLLLFIVMYCILYLYPPYDLLKYYIIMSSGMYSAVLREHYDEERSRQ